MLALSFLQNVYHSVRRNADILHQSEVTSWDFPEDFTSAVEAIITYGRYPGEQSSKLQTYGWTPTIFYPSTADNGREGVWRNGEFAGDLTLFVADLDNQHADRRMITMDDLVEYLGAKGLSHFLYTSFSHTAPRPKIRVVIPMSRNVTPREAYRIHTVFAADLDGQLDGSIYDPGDFIYGPPHRCQYVFDPARGSIDVDDYLALAPIGPEWWSEASPESPRLRSAPLTAQWSRLDTTPGVGLDNPEIFNPDWQGLLSGCYAGGSHRQSAFGLLVKAWIKSNGALTRGDLQALQSDMDHNWGGYLRSHYSRHDLEDDIRGVMTTAITTTAKTDYERRLEANLKRLNRKNGQGER